MPTMTFVVDVDGELPKNINEVEVKVQQALNDLGYQYFVFNTRATEETICDIDKYLENLIGGDCVMSA